MKRHDTRGGVALASSSAAAVEKRGEEEPKRATPSLARSTAAARFVTNHRERCGVGGLPGKDVEDEEEGERVPGRRRRSGGRSVALAAMT